MYHVLNRANGRVKLFKTEEDYLGFERVLVAAWERVPIRILDWCLMPTHWHFVLWPRRDGELTAFLRWMALTHTQRWKQVHGAVGHGPLYQGRFKSFPIQADEHLLSVLRYVERNPVRSGLVKRAEKWRWGSCHVRENGGREGKELRALLCDWPVDRPRRWLEVVNEPQSEAEEARFAEHIQRNRPLGSESWMKRTVARLGLEQTVRPRGRPVGWRKPRETGEKAK